MRFAAIDRILHNKKATRITTGVGEPLRREGSNGDITIRSLKDKGVFIFVKYNNNWYARALFDGPAEIAMSNPGRTMQLFGWNPDSKAYQLIDSSDVLSIEFGSPGKMGLKLGTSGATSLNEVDDDITLSDSSITSYAIGTSVIEDGKTLTVGDGIEFAVSPLDPSVEEEQRINKRLRFDVEIRNYLRFIDNKFTWFKNEFATMPFFKHNATVDLLNTRNTVSASEINAQLEALTEKVNTKLGDINSTFSTVLNNINSLADNIDAVADQSLDRSEIPDSYDDISNIEYGTDVIPVEETKVISNEEKNDYKATTLTIMQGYWTFASSTNTWTFNNMYGGGTRPHGLSIGSSIMFTGSAPNPSEFDRFTRYFVAEEGFTTTTIKLKSTPGSHPIAGEVIIEGSADSTAGSVLWKTVDKTDLPNGTPPGYLPAPDKNYTNHRALPGLELVDGEDYTNVEFLDDDSGGVCTIGGEASTHTTQYLCEKAGGTWHQ